MVFISVLLLVRHLSVVFFNAAMLAFTTAVMAGTGRHLWNFNNPETKGQTNFLNQVFLAFTVTGLLTFFMCIMVYWDNSQVDQRWGDLVYINTFPSFILYVIDATIAYNVVKYTEKSYDRKYTEMAGGLLVTVGCLVFVALALNIVK